MAWITSEFRSNTLKMPVEVEWIVPQAMDRTSNYTKDLKVLILLHGANWDRCEWLLKSTIFDLVRQEPILVCMPSGKNSFYINTANGYAYMDYITKELPKYIKAHFCVSNDPKDWLIAGESMGGYGALVCGLNATGQFGNIASFSGALDVLSDAVNLPTIRKELIWGEDLDAKRCSDIDVYDLCHKVDEISRPKLFLCCGKQDSFYDMNVRFYEAVRKEYLVMSCFDQEGGHDFNYWNARLVEMIAWFLDTNDNQ